MDGPTAEIVRDDDRHVLAWRFLLTRRALPCQNPCRNALRHGRRRQDLLEGLRRARPPHASAYEGRPRTMRRGIAATVVAAVLAGFAGLPRALVSQPASGNPRVLVLTDIENEPDDAMSMVRFLIYANHLHGHDIRRPHRPAARDPELRPAEGLVHGPDTTRPAPRYRDVAHRPCGDGSRHTAVDPVPARDRHGRPMKVRVVTRPERPTARSAVAAASAVGPIGTGDSAPVLEHHAPRRTSDRAA